ncbi:MAG: SET domain-containing methyltransferase [Verrucomicrobiota bacterium]
MPKELVLSEKLKVQGDGVIAGRGLVATELIGKDELIWSPEPEPPFVDYAARKQIDDRVFYSQIDRDLFAKNHGDEWYLNHSCAPNCVLRDRKVIAARDIQIGEEASYDYGLTETGILWAFWCSCGAPRCRKHVSNDDYLSASLRKRLADYCPAHAEAQAAEASVRTVLKHGLRWRLYRFKHLIRGDKSSPQALFR